MAASKGMEFARDRENAKKLKEKKRRENKGKREKVYVVAISSYMPLKDVASYRASNVSSFLLHDLYLAAK